MPIGISMEAEGNVLLVENGDIVFAGDAGMQRVGNDFEAAVKAFVASTWAILLIAIRCPPGVTLK
ncbi:hypothetical protein [Streptomyces sp. NPDC005969]|uniref:hypothetical protein n=1 Tax=Streptomyces sp. NPDC005969 TaxID=3156722 RepID=UPI0033E8BD50